MRKLQNYADLIRWNKKKLICLINYVIALLKKLYNFIQWEELHISLQNLKKRHNRGA